MRHQRLRRKLGIRTKHRRALLRNLMKALIERKRIRTTLAKAKEASAFADRMVTLAKQGTLHARRLLTSELGCQDSAGQLMKQIVPHFKERQGGYTRVLRLMPRPGDNSKMALLEFTAVIDPPKKTKKAVKSGKTASEEKKPEKTLKPKAGDEKAPKAAAEKAPEAKTEKQDSEKKGGFLGSLRKFLKGED